jgi:hypothetical protein
MLLEIRGAQRDDDDGFYVERDRTKGLDAEFLEVFSARRS